MAGIVAVAGYQMSSMSAGDVTAPPSFAQPDVMEPRRNLFVSGHSLTDRPMLDELALLAGRGDGPLAWNKQTAPGSSIEQRSMGPDAGRPWSGFAFGVDRDGAPIDVLAEWRHRADAAEPYDALLITEQHWMLDAVTKQGSVGYLAAYAGRFLEVNPDASVHFMAPWLAVSDMGKPDAWMAYERAAAPVWCGVVSAANRGLSQSGSTSQIHFIPANLALVELVDYLLKDGGAAGFEGLAPDAIMQALFRDDVHLSALGEWFIANVVAASLGIEPSDSAPQPDPARSTVQRFAQAFAADYRGANHSCASRPSLAFAWAYTGYIAETYRPAGDGLRAWIRRLRDTAIYVGSRRAWG